MFACDDENKIKREKFKAGKKKGSASSVELRCMSQHAAVKARH